MTRPATRRSTSPEPDTAAAAPVALATLFGDDTINYIHSLVSRDTSFWREAGKFLIGLCVANDTLPDNDRLTQREIYQNAARHFGYAEVTLRGWQSDEEIFGELIDEFTGTVSRQHLRDIRTEARLTEADYAVVFLEWAGRAPDYGTLEPHSHFVMRMKNGADDERVDPVVRSLSAAEARLATCVRKLAQRIAGEADGKRRQALIGLQRRVKVLAERAEDLRGEAEKLPLDK